jgi:probable HAF family extracellular repeat protein
MNSILRYTAVALLLLLATAEDALAQSSFVYSTHTKSFTTLDSGYSALGINDLGDTVGIYPTDGTLPIHGFIKRGSLISSFDYPGAYDTSPHGINNIGQVVGTRCSWSAGLLPECTGFLKSGNALTEYDYPGATFTYANGINNAGHAVGTYRVEVIVGPNTVQDFDHGVMMFGGNLTVFDFPGAYGTSASGVNDASQIVGTYVDLVNEWPGYRYHGYIKEGATFTSIDYPGALFTFASGINGLGQIVGSFQDRYGYLHGFVKSGATFTPFDIPGADTFPSGINSFGQIVGNYSPRPVARTISNFIAWVNGLGMPAGTTTSLATKLNAAITTFNADDIATACVNIEAFTSQVNALAGKKLTPLQAADLLAAAAQMEAMLGCR